MTKLSVVLIVMAAACESKEAPPPTDSESPEPNMTGTRPHRMANCPSAVPGAMTKVVTTPIGVEVTVTAADPITQKKIVELARFHARHLPVKPGNPRHTGKREGPAQLGFCPTVHASTVVVLTEVPRGVRLEIWPILPQWAKELREATKARAARLPGYVSS